MNDCPHCARSMGSELPAGLRPVCPHCGAAVSALSGQAWTDVARVTNLAEAGFLTDELIGRDLDARIYQLDEFSAVGDRWATKYFIRVPSEQAPAAAAWIRQQLAEDATVEGECESGRFLLSTIDDSIDPTFWKPVVLVVLAGVASFVLGQHFSDGQGRRLSSRHSLSSAVDRIGRPLVTEPAAGLPRHKLVFDRQREAWYLYSDLDGDGLYDSRQQFHASGAAW
jgi:hypothetical protein